MFLDLTDDEEQKSFEMVPSGEYKVTIEEAGLKDYQNMDGEYLKVTFSIEEGEYENQKIFMNYNFAHPESDEANRIGRGQLKSMLAVFGKNGIEQDPAELEDEQLYIKVKKVKKGEYENHNIQKYMSVEDYEGAKKSTKTKKTQAAAKKKTTTKKKVEVMQEAPELEDIPF